jgi:hypothetical protein
VGRGDPPKHTPGPTHLLPQPGGFERLCAVGVNENAPEISQFASDHLGDG